MSSKLNLFRQEYFKKKRTYRNHSLAIKLEVIKRKKNGERNSDISRSLGIATSTIHEFLKRANILEATATTKQHSGRKLLFQRNNVKEKMEKQLAIWVKRLDQLNMPITVNIVQEKALTLYDDICKKVGKKDRDKVKKFVASQEWFCHFQKRFGFKDMMFQKKNAGMDINAAQSCLAEVKIMIEKEQYSPKQIFNAAEMGLYWKRMPSSTYISQREKNMPGFKASKDRATLLIGGNAHGDKKLKPLLVFRNENPQALKNIAKSLLPVIWKSNKKALVTRQIFCDWFLDYFVPEAKKYCEKENLEFKVVLILDNAKPHDIDFVSLCTNVKVMLLPPNTASVLQPMDQGVIMVLKAHYLQLMFQKLIEEADINSDNSVEIFWKKFNIFDCIKLLSEAWELMTPQLMNECWKNLYPNALYTFEEIDLDNLNMQIATLATRAGFLQVDKTEVNELLESHTVPLTNEDLEELIQQTMEEERAEEDESEDEKEIKIGLTVQGLQLAISKANDAVSYFKENDPLYERASEFEHGIKNLLSSYHEILSQKLHAVKQTLLNSFLRQL